MTTHAQWEQEWEGAELAAEAIVPLIAELSDPRSVIDVGCGPGAWLAAFQHQGVEEILGVDGSYLDRGSLLIPPECYQAADLRQPLRVSRKFDLAISLEVAEHLPAARGPEFVRELTALAPVVLFSAAIPGQGGLDHMNEQWPDFWAVQFDRHGYRIIDAIRTRFWENEYVQPWYAQNSFLYADEDHLSRAPRLADEASKGVGMPLRAVHPKIFEWQVEEGNARRSHLRRWLRPKRKA